MKLILTILASALCAVHSAKAIYVVGPDFPITIDSFDLVGIINGQVSLQHFDSSFEQTTLQMSDPSTSTRLQANWSVERFDESVSTDETNDNFGIGASIHGRVFLGGPDSPATFARIAFTLTAPVQYSLAGFLSVVAQETGGINTLIAGFGPPPTVTAASLVDTGSGTSGVPPKLFAPLPALTGILLPGRYVFESASATFGGPEAENSIVFGLVAKPAPDGGSTLLMLGLGMGALGFWRRRIEG